MRVFLSWSGSHSHALAKILHDWLPNVLPFVDPWMSSEDIPKGSRWVAEIGGILEECDYCIVCLTREAARQPWVNFEAGAISRSVVNSHVSPLLLDVTTRDLTDLPLTMFQCTTFNKSDVHKLLESINRAHDSPVEESNLESDFEKTWDGVWEKVMQVAPPKTSEPQETDDDWIHQHDAVKMIIGDSNVIEGIRESVLSLCDPHIDGIDAVNEEYQGRMQKVPRQLLHDFASENPSAYYNGLYQQVALSFWLKRRKT